MDKYLIVSACSYTGPPAGVYRRYVDPGHRSDFEAWLSSTGADRHALPNHIVSGGPLYGDDELERIGALGGDRFHRTWDPGVRIAEMDAQGVAAEVIFPDFRLGAQPPFEPVHGPGGPLELQRAGARAYNRWLAEFCAEEPDRYAGVAVVVPGDVEAAVADIEWAKRAGLRGVLLPKITGAPPTGGLPRLGAADPAHEPIWAACESLGLPVHTLGGTGMPDYGELPGAALLHNFDWPVSANSGLGVVMLGGILEQHPRLQVVLTDQGTRRIVDLLTEWDTTHLSSRFNTSYYAMIRRPWDYWARQCFAAPSPMRRHDCDLRAVLGVSQLMWSSRYPQPVGAWLDVAAELHHLFAGVPERETRAIVGGNAVRAYSLDRDTLAAVAGRIGIDPAANAA